MQETAVRFTWRGRETIEALRELLRDGGHAEVEFAPEYHYALYRHLAVHNRPRTRVEQLDAEGDAALLEATARVHGLEELATLVDSLRARSVRVHIVSPGPTLHLSVPRHPSDDYPGD